MENKKTKEAKQTVVECDFNCGREAVTKLCEICFEEQLQESFHDGENSIMDK